MFYTQIIVQAPLAVDSFFFLRFPLLSLNLNTPVFSGMLSSYLFFKRVLKLRTLRNFTSPIIWLMIAFKRYTRLTPTYAVIMLFNVTLFTYLSSGPFWRPIESQVRRELAKFKKKAGVPLKPLIFPIKQAHRAQIFRISG